jgi:hypothetical protein
MQAKLHHNNSSTMRLPDLSCSRCDIVFAAYEGDKCPLCYGRLKNPPKPSPKKKSKSKSHPGRRTHAANHSAKSQLLRSEQRLEELYPDELHGIDSDEDEDEAQYDILDQTPLKLAQEMMGKIFQGFSEPFTTKPFVVHESEIKTRRK